MSEDLQNQRYYVLERISELREQIPQAMQAMVVFRARIEKYRQTDLSAAHDTYDALRRVRDDLTQALADVQPLLMELESYALAAMAGQLLRGFKGFDLMSTGYRPVYDAVCRFAQQLPEKNTVNAAIIGRLMNNVKLGYYPTDPDMKRSPSWTRPDGAGLSLTPRRFGVGRSRQAAPSAVTTARGNII